MSCLTVARVRLTCQPLEWTARQIQNPISTKVGCWALWTETQRKFFVAAAPDMTVKKGAPPPPDSWDDVKDHVGRFKDGSVMCPDGAWAYAKGKRLKVVPTEVPRIPAKHKSQKGGAKQFTKYSGIPKSQLSPKLTAVTTKNGNLAAGSSTAKFIGGT